MPLTLVSFAAAVNLPRALGAPMMPWGWLVFALCFTPTLLCADYIRAWSDTSVTLWMWFVCLLCISGWSVQNWVALPNIVLPWGGNRIWKSIAVSTGAALAHYLSHLCWSRLSRWGHTDATAGEGAGH